MNVYNLWSYLTSISLGQLFIFEEEAGVTCDPQVTYMTYSWEVAGYQYPCIAL